MSTYTIRLQRLLSSNFDIWDRERPFPIFNEAHRAELEKMIEDHYLMQEIGFEAPMTFKHYLNTRMREIMPKYNAMYESVGVYNEEDFFTYKENGSSSGETQNSSTDTTSNRSDVKNNVETRQYQYDTPMNMTSESLGGDHMSGAVVNKANGDNNHTETEGSGEVVRDGNGTHSDNYERKVNGQSPYKTIEEYRSLVFNIDKLVIEELGDLFMQIF